ncbi:transcriptional adapter 2-alpha [Rhinophrynus dorsalis]
MERLAPFCNDPFDKPSCRGCSTYLLEPYIKCAACGPPVFLFCLQCFARGSEYKKHQSDHSYEIMTSDFPVLDVNWTAQEEIALLEAVMDCGFGNWQDVAIQMRTRTKEDCEMHYMKHFINNQLFASTLLIMKQAEEEKHMNTAISFQSTEDPPRPTFESLLSRDMAGYMPARADFIEEFDNYAEWDLRDIDFVEEDSDILHALKIAVVDIYHSRLRERQRRKRIIRDHGLINLKKFQMRQDHLWSLESSNLRMGKPFVVQYGTLLTTDTSFYGWGSALGHLGVQGRWNVEETLLTINILDLRAILHAPVYWYVAYINKQGGTRRVSTWIHFLCHADRISSSMATSGEHSGVHQISPVISSSGRRCAPPLDLTGLPGTEKLNEKERELCQMVRLVPGAYLEYKAALMNEFNKQGSLRLAQARALIKIDVNKTRKIYDFLIGEGFINKP